MKKFILAALAVSLVSTPALAAPGQRQDQRTASHTVKTQTHGSIANRNVSNRKMVRQTVVQRKVVRTSTVQSRHWAKGQRFDARYARDYRVVQAPRNHRLYDAPRGYHWVQSGNDAVLVGIASGIIGAVIAGALN